MLKDLIKQLREEKHYTLKKLSDITGISTVQLKNIEDGKNKPSGVTLYKLSQALDYDYDVLFELSKE